MGWNNLTSPDYAPTLDGVVTKRITVTKSQMVNPVALWSGFAGVHLLLVWLNLNAPGWPLGDVNSVYILWAQNAADGYSRMGIDLEWVYPILAFVPMAVAYLLPLEYSHAWLLLMVALNAAAFAVLVGRTPTRSRAIAAWWWLLFLVALGPITLGRIDTVTVPLSIIGLLLLLSRPALAGLLITAGAWVKVWPGALLAAAFVTLRSRLIVLTSALALTTFIVAVSLLAGAGNRVWGFIAHQGDRGLQVESWLAVPFLWSIALGSKDHTIAYDNIIFTFEVDGPGVAQVLTLATPLMIGLVALFLVVATVAIRRGAHVITVLPPLALGLTMTLIVTNKVGSPQFVTWLAPAIILAVVWSRRTYRHYAVLALLVAVLTHLIYPYLYGWFLIAHPAMVAAATLRALAELVIVTLTLITLFTQALSPGTGRAGGRASGLPRSGFRLPTHVSATQPSSERRDQRLGTSRERA